MMTTSVGGAGFPAMDPAEMRQQMFKRMDGDGDGKVTRAEFTSRMPPGPDVEGAAGRGPSVDEIFESADADKDGAIDESEHDAFVERMAPPEPPGQGVRTQSLFAAIDADQDESVSADELQNWLQQMNVTRFLASNYSQGAGSGEGTAEARVVAVA